MVPRGSFRFHKKISVMSDLHGRMLHRWSMHQGVRPSLIVATFKLTAGGGVRIILGVRTEVGRPCDGNCREIIQCPDIFHVAFLLFVSVLQTKLSFFSSIGSWCSGIFAIAEPVYGARGLRLAVCYSRSSCSFRPSFLVTSSRSASCSFTSAPMVMTNAVINSQLISTRAAEADP